MQCESSYTSFCFGVTIASLFDCNVTFNLGEAMGFLSLDTELPCHELFVDIRMGSWDIRTSLSSIRRDICNTYLLYANYEGSMLRSADKCKRQVPSLVALVNRRSSSTILMYDDQNTKLDFVKLPTRINSLKVVIIVANICHSKIS